MFPLLSGRSSPSPGNNPLLLQEKTVDKEATVVLSIREINKVDNMPVGLHKENITSDPLENLFRCDKSYSKIASWLNIIEGIKRAELKTKKEEGEEGKINKKEREVVENLKDLVRFIYKGNSYKSTSRIKREQSQRDFQDACNRIGFCRAAPLLSLNLSRSIHLETGNCGEMADIVSLLCYGCGLSTTRVMYYVPDGGDFEHVACRVKIGDENCIIDPWFNIISTEDDYFNALKNKAVEWQKKGKFITSGLDKKEEGFFFGGGTPDAAEIKPDTLLKLKLCTSIQWTDEIYDGVEEGVLLDCLKEKIKKKAEFRKNSSSVTNQIKNSQINAEALTNWYQYIYNPLLLTQPPEQGFQAIKELTAMLADNPAAERLNIVAMALTTKMSNDQHVGNKIARIVAGGKMSLLADAYISLIYLLYNDNILSKKEILSLLLPERKNEPVLSLSHAITGAEWKSDAATRLCLLLSDIAAAEGECHQIIRRLGLVQTGYRFEQRKLSPPADFYALAKRADKLHSNPAAKALLKTSNLIPKKRALYLRSTNLKAKVIWESDYKTLLKRIDDAEIQLG